MTLDFRLFKIRTDLLIPSGRIKERVYYYIFLCRFQKKNTKNIYFLPFPDLVYIFYKFATQQPVTKRIHSTIAFPI